jgi:uncharacterized protein YggU (UPF0235/DUF167 family)
MPVKNSSQKFSILRIVAIPESRADYVEELKDGRLRVFLNAKKEQGMANERLLEVLSEYLKVPKKTLNIISGHKRPSKKVLILGS